VAEDRPYELNDDLSVRNHSFGWTPSSLGEKPLEVESSPDGGRRSGAELDKHLFKTSRATWTYGRS
jgi:hypothetical protein